MLLFASENGDDASDEPAPNWNAPHRIERQRVWRRAARRAWFIGGVQVVLFGWLTVSLLVLSSMPQDDLRKELLATQEPQTVDQVLRMQPMFAPFAGAAALMGLLPGMAYLGLGFLVRRGRTAAINMTLVIVITQAIVVGVLLLANLLLGIANLKPAYVTVNVLLFGTPLALLVFAARSLMQARAAAAEPDDFVEPWDRGQP